jgi:molybdopterin-guanine dinucleotide biosynthesis protein A
VTGPVAFAPLAAPARDQITGLVLAGGRGRRMGGADKGLVAWQGVPLVVHVLQRLQPQVAHLLISANRNLDTYRSWAPVIEDPAPLAFAGPLTGVLAALHAMRTDWLAVAPCDLPGLPHDAVARLAAGLAGRPASYAAPAGTGHSLVCLLHRSLAPALARHLAERGPRVAAWFAACSARAVPFADADAFVNLNAPADLASAAPR